MKKLLVALLVFSAVPVRAEQAADAPASAPAAAPYFPEGHQRGEVAHERVSQLEDVSIGLVRDGAYIFTAPLRIDRKGVAYLAMAGGGFYFLTTVDRRIANSVQHSRRRQLKKTFKDLGEDEGIEMFGRSRGALLTSVAFYTGGTAFDNPRAQRVAFINAEAWLYNDTAAKLLKWAFGRSRPGGRDPYDFNPFHGGSSLPSGHTSTAFCTASVIATEYDSMWVDVASYGTASMVGFSRMYRDVHWASDVFISAIMGITIGKTTHWLYRQSPRDWKILWAGDEIRLVRRF